MSTMKELLAQGMRYQEARKVRRNDPARENHVARFADALECEDDYAQAIVDRCIELAGGNRLVAYRTVSFCSNLLDHYGRDEGSIIGSLMRGITWGDTHDNDLPQCPALDIDTKLGDTSLPVESRRLVE